MLALCGTFQVIGVC